MRSQTCWRASSVPFLGYDLVVQCRLCEAVARFRIPESQVKEVHRCGVDPKEFRE